MPRYNAGKQKDAPLPVVKLGRPNSDPQKAFF